jgi:ankyrin repeat protein
MENPNPYVVEALVKTRSGAKPEPRSDRGAAGADINAKNANGRTVLMAAAGHSNPDVIAALVNAKDEDGDTVLDRARHFDNSRAMTALIKAGARGK